MSKVPHGTINCYQRGCRRDACRAAWATYIRERRHRLGLQQPRGERRFYEGPFESLGEVKATELAKARLDAALERTGKTKHDVLEQLLRNYADGVCFDANC